MINKSIAIVNSNITDGVNQGTVKTHIEELKLNPEVTNLVANLIESMIERGNKYSTDKQQLVWKF